MCHVSAFKTFPLCFVISLYIGIGSLVIDSSHCVFIFRFQKFQVLYFLLFSQALCLKASVSAHLGSLVVSHQTRGRHIHSLK